MIRVSIVTLSFNQAEFLERAIQSVLEQDYADIEYIVVDPGSTDGSREILRRYGDRITKLLLEPDHGPADGLNKGFHYASGKIFAFLNADDYLLPGAITTVVERFTKAPNTDVMSGRAYKVDANGRLLARMIPDIIRRKPYAFGAVAIVQQGTFFRDRAYRKTAGFNTANRSCWDAELFLDMCLSGASFQLIPEWLACFRIHDQSISGTDRLATEYAEDSRRLVRKALGRDRTRLDTLTSIFYRLMRPVLNPAIIYYKLQDKVEPQRVIP